MGSKLARVVAVMGAFVAAVSVGAGVIPQHEGPISQERVYLGTRSGVTALDADTGEAVFSTRDAVPAGGWSLLVSARSHGDSTTVCSSSQRALSS